MTERELSKLPPGVPRDDEIAATSAALQGNVLRPVLLARFDIESDPVVAWTGPGIFAPSASTTYDPAMDGQVFLPAAPIVEMSSINENQGIGNAVTITVSGAANTEDGTVPITQIIDETLMRQVVRDKREWRGRNAWVWIGFLKATEDVMIASPIRVKTGVMTQMTVDRRQETVSVTVTVDKDLGRAKGSHFRWMDHQRIYPADLWSSYILRLAASPEGVTNTGLSGGYGGGSGGQDRPAKRLH